MKILTKKKQEELLTKIATCQAIATRCVTDITYKDEVNVH